MSLSPASTWLNNLVIAPPKDGTTGLWHKAGSGSNLIFRDGIESTVESLLVAMVEGFTEWVFAAESGAFKPVRVFELTFVVFRLQF